MPRDIGILLPGSTQTSSMISAVTVPGFLSAEECAQLITVAEERGMTRAGLTGGLKAGNIRSASSCWIDEDDVSWLADKMIRGLATLARQSFDYDLTGFEEGFQLLRYDGLEVDGEPDFYDWHIDIGRSGVNASRKLSLVVQLSDPSDYEGGLLEVNAAGNVEAQPRAIGCLTAFPSFVLHRVSPVTKGVRYSLAAWAHGPAFR